jgi:hypothetical protein
MLVIFTVFIILSLVNVLIFIVEDLHHRKALLRNDNSYNLLSRKNKPIMVTTVRDGKMQNTYILLDGDDQHDSRFSLRTSRSVVEKLLFHSNISVN